jgi:hypothetical protein
MDSQTDALNVYRDLADRYDKLNQFSMRDRFLMLAASAALDAGQVAEAERLRGRLLQQNRHHMLRPYGSFEEAVGAPDVQTYLVDLKTNYPPDLAEQLLASLKDGKPPPPSKPLSQRRPALDPAPAPIPPTAPVVDPYQPPAKPARPTWESAVPYRMADEVEVTAPVPDMRDLARPAPQPAKPRAPRPSPSSETERHPIRPTVPVPLPVPAPRPAAPKPTAAPVAPEPEPHREDAGGAWLCVLLTGIAAVAGLAVGGFTLARPFLPPGWMP